MIVPDGLWVFVEERDRWSVVLVAFWGLGCHRAALLGLFWEQRWYELGWFGFPTRIHLGAVSRHCSLMQP